MGHVRLGEPSCRPGLLCRPAPRGEKGKTSLQQQAVLPTPHTLRGSITGS